MDLGGQAGEGMGPRQDALNQPGPARVTGGAGLLFLLRPLTSLKVKDTSPPASAQSCCEKCEASKFVLFSQLRHGRADVLNASLPGPLPPYDGVLLASQRRTTPLCDRFPQTPRSSWGRATSPCSSVNSHFALLEAVLESAHC